MLSEDKEARFKEIDLYVGEVIKHMRTTKRIPANELAQSIGVSQPQLNKYERGINRISAGKLYVLAEMLGADIWEFFPVDAPSERCVNQTSELQRAFIQLPDDYTKSRVVELVKCMAYGQRTHAIGKG